MYKEQDNSKKIINKLSKEGYSETASKAISIWYITTTKKAPTS